MAEGGASTSGTQPSPSDNPDGSEANASYECNICLDTAKDAVISMCGHLFCWPCLHTWLETRRAQPVCPVCKAGISKDKVIPLFGRGSTDNKDPRDKIPPRPPGQRSEPEAANPFTNMNMGFQMSFGIGAFPFTFFNMRSANMGDPMWQAAGGQTNEQRAEELWLSKVFLCIAIFFGLWLIVA